MLSGRAWLSAVVTGTFYPLVVPIFKETFQIEVVKVIKGSKNMPSNYPKRGIIINLRGKKGMPANELIFTQQKNSVQCLNVCFKVEIKHMF